MRRNYHSEESSPEERLARLAKLSRHDVVNLIIPNPDSIYNRETGEWIESGLDTTYGRWEQCKRSPEDSDFDASKVYAYIRYCSGSDYSGDLVEVSNYKAMLAEMPEGYEDGSEYLKYSGGYGTFGLAIRADSLTDELLDALDGLEDYPILDESLHSELESESQNEAWESWVKSDFQRELGKAMFAAFEASPQSEPRDGESAADYEARLAETEEYLSDDCGEIPEDKINELFFRLAELANENWVNEQGSDSYIDVEDVVKRGLETPAKHREWAIGEHALVIAQIRESMSDRKYDLGLVRYIDPNQLNLTLEESA